jgi:hypothetical protein
MSLTLGPSRSIAGRFAKNKERTHSKRFGKGLVARGRLSPLPMPR